LIPLISLADPVVCALTFSLSNEVIVSAALLAIPVARGIYLNAEKRQGRLFNTSRLLIVFAMNKIA
jgi:hypothetical protein